MLRLLWSGNYRLLAYLFYIPSSWIKMDQGEVWMWTFPPWNSLLTRLGSWISTTTDSSYLYSLHPWILLSWQAPYPPPNPPNPPNPLQERDSLAKNLSFLLEMRLLYTPLMITVSMVVQWKMGCHSHSLVVCSIPGPCCPCGRYSTSNCSWSHYLRRRWIAASCTQEIAEGWLFSKGNGKFRQAFTHYVPNKRALV